MSVGVELSNEDLEAIRKLYKVRWSADIRNWKERDTDYCMWFVYCPNKKGAYIVETGKCLAEVINRILQKALE